MKTQLTTIMGAGSSVAGWLKAIALIFTFISAMAVAYSKLGEVEIDTVNNTSQIQTLRENSIKHDSRIQILENDRVRQDAFNEKMMATLNNLNLSLERLNTTMDMMQKTKGS